MKRLARFAVMGAIALGSMVAAANAAPIIPNSSSQMDPNIVQVWGGCAWGFIPARGAATCQIAGYMIDIGPTGALTMAAGTIRMGITDIGMDTDAESETKRYQKEE